MPEPLQNLIAKRYGGLELPIAVVLPDGGRVPLSPTPEVEVTARSVMGQHEVAATLGEVPTPGFTVFDLRGFWQVTPNLLLVSGVENFGDKFYREHLDPRRSSLPQYKIVLGEPL